MGIPSFFRVIVDKHPDMIKDLDKIKDCDWLMFDFNCLLHRAVDKVLSKAMITSTTRINNMVIDEAFSLLHSIVTRIKPNNVVIAIDGVPPLAKVRQQRIRRSMGSMFDEDMRMLRQEQGLKTVNWPRTHVSPYTPFMDLLNERLLELPSNWHIDSAMQRGEGEHKIMHFLRSNSVKGQVLIHGLDADLIILSILALGNKDYTIMLLREANYMTNKDSDELLLLDIPLLRAELEDPEEFCIITMFLGNDFLPRLSYLSVQTDGLTKISKVYSSVKQTHSKLYSDGKLSMSFLRAMFSILAQDEVSELCQMDKRYHNYKPKPIGTPIDVLKHKQEQYPLYNKPTWRINYNTDNWQEDYYRYLFPDAGLRIDNFCNDYLTSLIWNISYYLNRPVNGLPVGDCNWSYCFGYSPLLEHLSKHNYISHSFTTLILSKERYLRYIIPFAQRHILSKTMADTIPETKFIIQTYLKRYAHECWLLFE